MVFSDVYYTYNYVYGNGDFYTGYGYADAYQNYAPGQTFSTLNETGSYGYYYITSTSYYGIDYNFQGLTYVNSYYDAGSGSYGNVTNVTGYSGLGSESGYAYNSSYSNTNFLFGQGYYEADLGNPDQYYTYTYVYNNGDFYTGYGYTDTASGYYAGQTFTTFNETGYYGYYYITSTYNYGIDYSYQGLTYVSSYYDAGSIDYSYTATGEIYDYVGVTGLGSESGYIYGYYGNYFGEGYYEADYYFFT